MTRRECCTPALGLDAFSAGIAGRTRTGVWLLVAAALVVAYAVDRVTNRRMRLGAEN
ncbi:hypothetical protein [Actinoplanes friuliensis]|uniref:hypothetical protein n=1 Tax=Actinoplanes friuliensis TaxID=196914 RepID=UPI00041DCDC3|nr:hypothetical protein [Actinoplanes friuliensis]